ncbi:Hexose_transporter [Hexamita inflata]|uniref:Hexose_transporter n=1 Tax=Hexamita inflata TaxID=28002 RepID=A0ABP1KT97_9EUKA
MNGLLISAYIFCGLSRGSLVASISTVIMAMYKQKSWTSFTLTKPIISLISISVLTGSAFGAFLATPIIARFGRKNTLIFFGFMQVLAECLTIIPVGWIFLSVFRLISGIASNFTLSIVPMLCAEFLEPKIRGVIGSVLNTAISTGIVLTNVVQYFICVNNNLYWVIMILPVASSALTLVIAFKLKETSQMVGKIENIESIFKIKYIKCFAVAWGIGFMISGTGINPVLQYSTIIFKNSFNSTRSSSIGSIISSGINMISAFIAIPIVRNFKRKTLLACGYSLMLVTYIMYIVSQTQHVSTDQSNDLVIVATCILSLAYSSSSGPLFYILNSEVFPLVIKTKMMVIVMFISWTTLIAITFIFPLISLTNNVIIYICLVVMMLVVLMTFLPETMGKTLQENSKLMIIQRKQEREEEQNTEEQSQEPRIEMAVPINNDAPIIETVQFDQEQK